jgi:arylsulfatase A-like enzyme
VRKAQGNFDQRTEGLTLQAWIQQMNECALAIDDGVGQIVETLKATGQLDNTLIMYVADQGYAMGEHGLNAKIAPYDGSVASPLIISYPGVTTPGTFCQQPVNSPDLVATILASSGIAVPWVLHGHDITPQLRDPNTIIERPMLLTHTGRSYGDDANILDPAATNLNGFPWWVLLRDQRFKYVRYLIPGEMEELYDLKHDPEELVNLATKPAHHARLVQMRAATIAELKRTEAGFAEQMPAVATQ